MKTKLYKFHKKAAWLVFIPIFLWVLSGIMHPLMSNFFKPKLAHRSYKAPAINTNTLGHSIQEALQINNINEVKNVRVTTVNNEQYYQIEQRKSHPVYIHTKSAKIKEGFDIEYAKYLARYFLNDYKSDIAAVTKLSYYDTHYKRVNRLLPVYKVSFNRSDGMELYIHTTSSRLGTFNNNLRKGYIWLFHHFHNWGFLPEGPIRILFVSLFSAMAFITSIAGLWIYGLGWKNFKKQKIRNNYLKKRKSHRSYGIIFSIFCLMFSFSGSYHALKKINPDVRHTIQDTTLTPTQYLKYSLNEVIPNNNQLTQSSIITFNNHTYYRCVFGNQKKSQIKYCNTQTGTWHDNLDRNYCEILALRFSKLKKTAITATSFITRFKGEYGFINKRLPVYKITFNDSNDTSYYIESSSGKLAALITNSDRTEGFSFAFLHKFHFLDTLGKQTRDLIASLAALSMLLVAFKGWKIRRYLK